MSLCRQCELGGTKKHFVFYCFFLKICFGSNALVESMIFFSFKLIPANCCLFQKSKQQGEQETDSSQNSGFGKSTLAEQKVASCFVVQDAVRNVTHKPKTTERQDDVARGLPHYTSYTSPRMKKTQAHVQESTVNRHKNVQPKVYNSYKWDCYRWDDSQAEAICLSIATQLFIWLASSPTSQSVSESFGGPVSQTVGQRVIHKYE